jgi:outer membrane protein OmpU
MTKYLLAGCAAAAFTMVGGIANAQDFKVTISGEAKFEAYFSGQKKDAGTRNIDFRNRFRLTVNPEAVGLGGALTYGANVMLKNESNASTTSFENNFIYLKGAFGTVSLGDMASYNDGPGGVTKPQDWISENDGQLGYVGDSKDPLYTGKTLEAWRDQTVNLGDQSTRIRYESPIMSGFQIGASYTPQLADDAWSWNRDKTKAAQDIYEIGVKFDSTDKTIADRFGGALLKVSASYAGGKNKATVSNGFSFEDPAAYQAGLQVGYAGFVVGGHYVNWGKTNLWKGDTQKTTRYSYGVGAQYTTGPVVVGVGYTYSQKDADFTADATGKKTAASFTAGAKYTVSKGLDVFADYGYVKTKNSNTNDSDTANVLMIGTALGF